MPINYVKSQLKRKQRHICKGIYKSPNSKWFYYFVTSVGLFAAFVVCANNHTSKAINRYLNFIFSHCLKFHFGKFQRQSERETKQGRLCDKGRGNVAWKMRGQRPWFVWQFARGPRHSKVCFKKCSLFGYESRVCWLQARIFLHKPGLALPPLCMCVSVCTGVGCLTCFPGQLGMPARVLIIFTHTHVHTNCANSLGSIKLLCTLLSIPFDPLKTLPSKG